MKDENKLAEKAELNQALKALFIPVALFIATVTFAAGIFLIYNEEVAGWGFLATTAILAVWGFIALLQYQNSYRARGIMPDREDIMVEFTDELPLASARNIEKIEEEVVSAEPKPEPEPSEQTVL